MKRPKPNAYLRIAHTATLTPSDIDADSVIDSYTVMGTAHPGGHVILDSFVDSVSFLWKVYPGDPSEFTEGSFVQAQFLLQVFGWS